MGTDKTIEEWKDIIGYEGIYQISSHGRVKKLYREWIGGNGGKRSTNEKIMNTHYSKYGYNHQIFIKDSNPKDVRVCRLVCIHFHENPENKPFVNHKDGNKKNDYWENVEWNTRSENDIHAFKTGLRIGMVGSKNGMSILTEELVLQLRREYKGGRYHLLAKTYGLSIGMVGQVLRRETWKHL